MPAEIQSPIRRWLPFAIAGFMLTPFALWALFSALGLGGRAFAEHSPVGWVLFLASLPLAGLFWIQNLRQIGESMGAASRLGVAARLAAVLPASVAGIGLVGAGVLLWGGHGVAVAALVALATLGLAALARLAAAAPVEPGVAQVPGEDPARLDAQARQALLVFANLAAGLAFLAFAWTPWVLLWAVLAAVPVAFAAMLALAWWATETPLAAPAPEAAPRPANETAPLSRAA
jgi:hypothetical protein